MNVEALRSELAEGVIRPAYLIVGAEPLLRDDALALLRASVLAGAPEAFNFDRLDGESTRPAELLDAIGSLPVMAERRLVVLREPEGGRGRNTGLTDVIAEALGSIGGTVDTVLVVEAAKADRRARWVKGFKDPAAEVACDPPKTNRDLASFVAQEAKRQGVEVERGAVDLLVERVGPQLLLLRREIEKAALLAGDGAAIERTHVAAGTSDVAEEPIWDLTDAIGDGRGADALALLSKLFASGAAAPQVLGALAAHFRKLLRLRTGGSANGPPFVVRKLKQQAGRYTPGRLFTCLRAIHDTDTALKGAGALKPEMALERLVIGLAA